ncbi:prokaryotic E2 ligase family D protein [Chryseobacterium sp. MEBOG07]|uniref:prokaryotic E2 ligase family D protein n=1 Tax=Chryseobacterium sp. MEBOG07 TaxID=2879939 RepID=UPI001F3A6CF9|nr:prokaryotic E2 ligase family D protein [Chryseobacterium sp. MEBOG07]UKB78569.1 prokaryotic E2 ligase family D protein [Chryseobacterium sp. MEBOG07]
MNNQTDLTDNFGPLYYPKSALVFYETKGTNTDGYIESFDMDKNGHLINAHPLTVREANQLAKSLKVREEKESFLKPQGIMGRNILQIDPIHNGVVIWFTKAMSREMFFVEKLEIPNGKANVPAMLWVANRNKLFVYALSTDRRPTEKTTLFHAPYFNVYEDGAVCMGTVDVRIKKTASLEEFTTAWEEYFFNSYFSHLMQDHNPIKGNCVSLWKRLINTNDPFPKDVLIKSSRTLKDLLR